MIGGRVRVFPGIIFALLGLNMCIVAVTVYCATSDRSFAVEPGYDIKALNWEETARQRTRNETLAWTVDLSVDPLGTAGAAGSVLVSVRDGLGTPVDHGAVTVLAFPSARASRRENLALGERSEGRYGATLGAATPGLWVFRVRVEARGEVFTAEFERELRGGGA